MIRKNPLLAIFFLLASLNAFSQTPYFQSYFLLKKNEPVHINMIFQDKTGFIWFGTDKGLFKFNGKSYEHFTVSDSLPENNVTAIAQDSAGRIWTGHKNGAIAFLKNRSFVSFNPAEGTAVAPISDIIFDRNGVMWFSTLNDGLYYYSRERLFRLDDVEGMPDIYVYDLMEDADGNIWAGTDGGVALCRLENGKVKIDVLNYEDGLADNIVKKIVTDQDKTVLLATEDAGLIRYDAGSKQFSPIGTKWPYGGITDFSIDGNKIWISTTRPGLVVFDRDRNESAHYNIESAFNPGSISTLLKDREGNIWAGSRSGVVRTSGDKLAFIESFGMAKDVNVLAVAVDKNNDIWFSTNEGLFKRSINESGEITFKKPLAGTSLESFRVISLFVGEDGFIWAGLYGQGVLRIHPVSGRITHLSNELRNGNVLSITGKGNIIWLATLGGGERITLTGDKFTIKNFSTQNGLSSDFIYQVFIDGRDRVWFGTDGKGVDMLDDKGFHHIEDGLPSAVVYGFAEDRAHQIWVNVQGNGIYRLHDTHFVALDSNLQLRDNNINCLAADRAGNLMVMHDLGIDVLDINKSRIRYFNEDTGIRSKRATLNAVSKDSQGNLFIGTDGGIIRYVASEILTGTEPYVTIDAFKVFNQRINFTGVPVLAHDENSVTVNFSGLWFQNPESLSFQYKMENYDEDWILTRDNTVTYSKLPAGDYTFNVKVSDNHDFTHANLASVRFSIRPPFWKTPVFYVLCVVVLVTGGFVFIRFRERKLVHDKQVLEIKVEERTREIQLKTEEIQAQNEEIMAQAEEINGINENLEMLVKERTAELEKKNKALEEYAFINAHKLRSPLASILGLINLLSKSPLDEDTKIIKQHLQRRADELDDVVRSITEAIERGERSDVYKKTDKD